MSLSSAPLHRRCPPPNHPPATHASHAFSDERWGKGRARGGGGIIGIEGRKGETMGATRRKWDFFYFCGRMVAATKKQQSATVGACTIKYSIVRALTVADFTIDRSTA